MKIRLYNARILTMEENKDIFRGEIWIEDNRIVRILPDILNFSDTTIPHFTWDREIDCKENLTLN